MEIMSNNPRKILLINETFIIDHSVNDQWFDWFTNEFIPIVKDSGIVKDVILSKIQGDYNQDGENYAFQFKIKVDDYISYQNNSQLNSLQSKMRVDFRHKFGSFVTVLEVVAV